MMEERATRALAGATVGAAAAMVKADILPLTVKSVTVRLTRVSACACNDVGCARVARLATGLGCGISPNRSGDSGMLASYWSRAFRDQLAVKIHRLIAPFHRTSSVPSLELPVNNTFHVRSLLSDLPKVKSLAREPRTQVSIEPPPFPRVSTSPPQKPRSPPEVVLPRDASHPRARRRRRACARGLPPRLTRARVRSAAPSRRPRASRPASSRPSRSCPLRVAASRPSASALAVRAAGAGFPSVVRAAATRPSTLRRSSAACTTPSTAATSPPPSSSWTTTSCTRTSTSPPPSVGRRQSRSSSRNPATASPTTCSSSSTSARMAAA